jgi:hypothetical protein
MQRKLNFFHKIFQLFKNGQKKCPKMKIPKNFPEKISKIVATCVGPGFRSKNTKTPSLCRFKAYMPPLKPPITPYIHQGREKSPPPNGNQLFSLFKIQNINLL